MAVGVVLAEYFEGIGVEEIKLKWPNDIKVSGNKLGGILIELQSMPDGSTAVVIGVGLNIAMQKKEAVDIEQPWVDLSSLLGGPVDRNQVVANVIEKLINMLAIFESKGFGAFHNRWSRFDECQGRKVSLQSSNTAITGIARGVAVDGAIILEQDGERKHYYGGEVSLRMSK